MGIQRVTHLVKTGKIFPYALGRFSSVRRAYAMGLRLRPGSGNGRRLHANGKSTAFPNIQPTKAIEELHRDAVCFGFDLLSEHVEEIRAYALDNPCSRSGDARAFYYHDVNNGRLDDGTPVALGFVKRPEACPSIKALSEDPVLWEVCSGYLGYTPSKADIRLYWSFGSMLTDQERRNLSQTIDYHFDVYDFNFCYAHFYITPTNVNNGAHVMVKGSHVAKPVRWLFGSARKTGAEILSVYDPEDVLVIEGDAGTGFIEDTSCYHKAMPPVEGDRLLLQFRLH